MDRLEYDKMTDEQIIKKVRDFRSNSTVSSIATSRNVNSGKTTLEAMADTFQKLGVIGSGVTSIMGAASATKKFFSFSEKESKKDKKN